MVFCFCIELFLLKFTRIDIRAMQGNGAKVMHIEVSSAQGISESVDLLSGNHSGRQVGVNYLPEVCLAYTRVQLVQSRLYTEFCDFREL